MGTIPEAPLETDTVQELLIEASGFDCSTLCRREIKALGRIIGKTVREVRRSLEEIGTAEALPPNTPLAEEGIVNCCGAHANPKVPYKAHEYPLYNQHFGCLHAQNKNGIVQKLEDGMALLRVLRNGQKTTFDEVKYHYSGPERVDAWYIPAGNTMTELDGKLHDSHDGKLQGEKALTGKKLSAKAIPPARTLRSLRGNIVSAIRAELSS